MNTDIFFVAGMFLIFIVGCFVLLYSVIFATVYIVLDCEDAPGNPCDNMTEWVQAHPPYQPSAFQRFLALWRFG